MGHALRLLLVQETKLGGTVEIDEFFLGGKAKKSSRAPSPARGRKGQKRTTKKPVLAMVQRPGEIKTGASAGEARAAIVSNGSASEAQKVLESDVEPEAHIMSDEVKAFIAAGKGFVSHDRVCHSKPEYVRAPVHTNSVEGFNARVRRTVAGIFHHISPEHADLYFHEMGFRWSQRIITGQTTRQTRAGGEAIKIVWERIPPRLDSRLQSSTIMRMRSRRPSVN
jgi:hypothetical protein